MKLQDVYNDNDFIFSLIHFNFGISEFFDFTRKTLEIQ